MRYVVVGGGVAGVCCAEELCRTCPDASVSLLSASRMLKGVSVVARLSRTLEELALVERRLDELPYPNLTMVQGVAAGVDRQAEVLLLASGERLPYDKLCICAGARPKQLPPGVFKTGGSTAHQESTLKQQKQQQLTQADKGGDAQQAQQADEGGGAQQGRRGGEEAPAAGAELEQMRQRVLTIRDTDSVARLGRRLAHSRRVVVVGNGGIALELISGIKGADVTWVLKHGHIGDAFFDLDAAQFLLEELQQQRCQQQREQGQQQQQQEQQQQQQQQPALQALHSTQQQESLPGAPASPAGTSSGSAGGPGGAGSPTGVLGHAVGPRWVQQLLPEQTPTAGGPAAGSGSVALEYGCEVSAIQLMPTGQGRTSTDRQQQQQQQGQQEQVQQGCSKNAGASDSTGGTLPANPPALLVTLSNGKLLQADLVLLAIGVSPALEWVPPSLERGQDGGLRVNRHMQSSDPDIYAAGDSASCDWGEASGESAHWFQMRLWSQARSMGVYAAHCMAGVQDQTGSDMAFELFTHVTRFLGKKVVLLGLYNGQRLQGEPAHDMISYSRVTEGEERSFVRVLLLRGRMQGAVMIGETDLEETCENLILDQLDVSAYGPELLDPDAELDHVFD